MSTLQKSSHTGIAILLLIATALVMWLGPKLWAARQAAKFASDFTIIHESKPPLTLAQVESLLSHPTSIDHAESTGLVGDVYHYPTYPPGGDFKVIFINGSVFGTAVPPYTPNS